MGTSSFSVYLLPRRDARTIDLSVYDKHNLHYLLTNSISDFMMVVSRREHLSIFECYAFLGKRFYTKFFKYKKFENNILHSSINKI